LASLPKTYNEIVLDELKGLQGTAISNSREGSVARALLEIPAASISEAYINIKETAKNSFVSTASGQFLDMIGVLLGAYRQQSETDDQLKYRIKNALLYHAKGNTTAIQIAAEMVSGVSEVIIDEGSAGPGSFTLYVVSIKPNEAPWSLISQVFDAVRDVVACGTYFEILPITYLDVNADVEVIMKNDSSGFIDNSAVRAAVKNYILQIPSGGLLSTDQLKYAIMDTLGTNNVIKIIIRSLYISGKLINGDYKAPIGTAFTIDRFSTAPVGVTIHR
jgi:uncharacterized phage protein gp47/JayE